MYRSKEFLAKKSTSTLKQYLNLFLEQNSYVRCKALKNRKIFFTKLPAAIIKRKDLRDRLRSFWVGIDILKKSDHFSHRVIKGNNEYEFEGLSSENKRVFIHLREEVSRKDKKLFLISTYYKPTPPNFF